MELESDIIDG